jgi:membrane protein DedA with SNARE-associated domain
LRRRGECGKIKPIVNEATFLQLCEHLSDNLWLQGLLVAVGTCFLEDAGRCGVGLLVAAGHMEAWVALIGMFLGGISGDLGLYLTGRYATQFLLSRRWMNADRLTRMKEIFACHAVKAVLFSRFLPGARTVAYSVAGIVRYPFPRFLIMLCAASLVQALLFLWMGAFIGDHILPYLRQPHLSVALIAAVVLVGFLTHRALARRRARTGKE